jgi:prolipoprotein diacylglyceryltransferase
MSTLAQWAGSLLGLAIYAYVLGTAVWLLLFAPGMYKRQRQMLKRIDALERRIAEIAPPRPAT